MEIEKGFFFQVRSHLDQENPFAHSCSFTLQASYKNGMLGPGWGGGRLSECSKTIYDARPSNQVTFIILFTTVASLYTYFYLAEHNLVF